MGQSYVLLGWGTLERLPPGALDDDLWSTFRELGLRTPYEGKYGAIAPCLATGSIADDIVRDTKEDVQDLVLNFDSGSSGLDILLLMDDGIVKAAKKRWDKAREVMPFLPEGRLILVADYD